MQGLDPVAGRVELASQASKGETVIRLQLSEPSRAKVGDVLSDGEQRALALAFFLADVAVSDGRSAIVLDDPVSSLDHERRTYVARRLVEEAQRRQVIIFTHDLTFVYLLQEAAESVGCEVAGQTLQRANRQVGVVSDDLPTQAMSPSKRCKNLRHRLKTVLEPLHHREDPTYEREADAWTTDLRKAYDQLIEDYVLAGTVRRWHAQVRVRQLRQVKWSMDVVKRIEAGMKQASVKTHHEATSACAVHT
jgi:ABC-type multidrug transport system ATPase subunit